MFSKKSFTLIELIVVIGIIAVLSALGATSYNGFQKNARDSRRKQDLKTITAALNQYYAVHNRYPAPDPNNRFVNATGEWWGGGACNYNSNCYSSSVWGTNWIPELVEEGFIEALPQDPINNTPWPWVLNSTNYSYSYGNVYSDGQVYDLTTRLENTDDPDTCAEKDYRWGATGSNHWCVTHSGLYSDQVYELSPGTF